MNIFIGIIDADAPGFMWVASGVAFFVEDVGLE